MALAGTASITIAEMREFASFTAAEQRYIRRSLDIGLARRDAFALWGRSPAECMSIRGQYVAYQDLKTLRGPLPDESSLEGIEAFCGKLTRLAAFDMAQGGSRASAPSASYTNVCSARPCALGSPAPSAPPALCRRSRRNAASCCFNRSAKPPPPPRAGPPANPASTPNSSRKQRLNLGTSHRSAARRPRESCGGGSSSRG